MRNFRLLGNSASLNNQKSKLFNYLHSLKLVFSLASSFAGNRADHRRLFKLIQQMQQSGQIRFTQLIWEGDGRWIHISYVPGDLRCQVIE